MRFGVEIVRGGEDEDEPDYKVMLSAFGDALGDTTVMMEVSPNASVEDVEGALLRTIREFFDLIRTGILPS